MTVDLVARPGRRPGLRATRSRRCSPLGGDRRDRLRRRGSGQTSTRSCLVGRNIARPRLLPRPADAAAARSSCARPPPSSSRSGTGRLPAGRRRRVPARAGDRGARPDRDRGSHGKVVLVSLTTALVTGAPLAASARDRRRARGRGRRASRARPRRRLRRRPTPQAWARRRARRPRLPERGRAHARATIRRSVDELPPRPRRQRRRRRLRRPALAPRDARGSAFVVTASLAGLIAMAADPLYSLTKHAVVGYVRSVAPQLAARGIRINWSAPGSADTPMIDRAASADARRRAASRCWSRAGRRRRARRRDERGDGPGVGRPARPRAAPVPLPERPRPRVEGAEGTVPQL